MEKEAIRLALKAKFSTEIQANKVVARTLSKNTRLFEAEAASSIKTAIDSVKQKELRLEEERLQLKMD